MEPLDPLPDILPSVVDIKRSIPKHCFHPNLSTSVCYTIKDVILIMVTYYTFKSIQEITVLPMNVVAMVTYWGMQGTFFTAIFIIGHDCGHNSYSKYTLINDCVGTLCHGFLLLPYYMWKLSHQIHHKNNANIDKDEAFYPVRESEDCAEDKVLPGFGLGIGWYAYLLTGYEPRPIHHYTLTNPIFQDHLLGCSISFIMDILMLYFLVRFTMMHGVLSLFNYYIIPLFIFGSYAVIVTFLHHHEVNIPWYGQHKWDYIRGQLSMVDRHYGIVHHILHNIGTHQIHHIFPKIPHYKLEVATIQFRKAFPELVRVSDEKILFSFVRMFRKYNSQEVIADNTDIHLYK